MFVHTKLCVDETVTVGANWHCLIYNLLIAIVFSLHILLSVNSKNISRGYALHKGFGSFDLIGLKIDKSRTLRQQKLSETYIAESDFTFSLFYK